LNFALPEDMTIEWDALASPTIGTLVVDDLGIGDSEGPWLRVDHASLTWVPTRVFSGVLAIERLAAWTVSVARLPDGEEDAPPGTFAIPELPFGIDVASLSVDRLDLAAPVLGVADSLAISGRARLLPGGEAPVTDGEIHVERLASAPARFDAVWGYSVADDRLDLRIDLAEAANGTVQEVIGSRSDLPVSLHIEGTGSLSDWNGTLAFAAGPDAMATGTFRIADVDAGIALSASLDASLASMFADERAALLGGDVQLAVDSVWREAEGTFAIDRFELTAPAATANLTGSFTPAEEHYAASFTADIANGADLSALLGDLRFRDLHLVGNVDLAGDEMTGGAVLSLSDFAVEGISVARLEGELQPVDGPAAFRLTGRAETTRFASSQPRDLSFFLDGVVENGTPVATALSAETEGATASFTGRASLSAVAGTVAVDVADLAPFADLTGRPLGGAAAGSADVASTAPFSNWTVALTGTARDLALGIPQLDGLLRGAATVAGGVTLAAGRWELQDLQVTSPQIGASANGRFGNPEDTLVVRANLADIALIDPRASGAASAVATLTGGLDAMGISAEATMAEAMALERRAENVAIEFQGTLLEGVVEGDVALSGEAEDVPVSGTGSVRWAEGTLALSDAEIEAAGAIASGTVTLADGVPNGTIAVTATDLSTIAALFGVEARGAVAGNIVLSGTDMPRVDARLDSFAFGALEADQLTVETLDVDNLDAAWSGRIEGSGIRAGGTVIDTISGEVSSQGERMVVDVDLALLGGTAEAGGSVTQSDGDWLIDLERLALQKAGETITLAEPARLTFAGGAISTNALTLRSANGQAVITGTAGETFTLSARLDSLSLAMAELIVPNLGIRGTVSGSVELSGTASAPAARFDVRIANLTAPQLTSQGLPPVALTAQGTFADNAANASGRVSGIPGLSLSYSGTVPTSAGAPMNLALTGQVSIAEFNRFRRVATAEVDGTLSLDARVTGALSAPQISGSFRLSAGRYVDRIAGLSFTGLAGEASVSGNVVTLRNLNGTAANGGALSASGTVNLGSSGGPTANLSLTAQNARIIQSDFVTFDLDGNLRLEGPITRRPRVSGNAAVRRLEVNVAASLPTTVAAVDVTHVNAPARLNIPTHTGGGATSQGAFDAELDLALTAPGQVFLRGQGLAAELEGQLRLTGTLQRPVTVGAFDLRRGDLSVLGQRFDITSADLTFAGDIDPILDIAAETDAGDVTAIFRITGQASSPEFTITSEPELPPDEVLARLLFGKATGQLTAGEALALAQAATQLAGVGGGGGILEEIRQKTGLDRLTISTDQQGNAIVDIGRYIGDRAYVGIEQGATPGSTRATIDLDITDVLKGRAELGANGESRIGITVEREY
jgi:translocation and assembly module TamB